MSNNSSVEISLNPCSVFTKAGQFPLTMEFKKDLMEELLETMDDDFSLAVVVSRILLLDVNNKEISDVLLISCNKDTNRS